jgi:heparosan-N-sulfate-glucuronate 5-epimerase
MMKTVAVAISLLMLPTLAAGEERWPAWDSVAAGKRWARARNAALLKYQASSVEFVKVDSYRLETYLCRNSAPINTESALYEFDQFGVPMRRVRPESHYHPIQVARNAIAHSTLYFETPTLQRTFLIRANADRLIELMNENGGLEYSFSWQYYIGPQTLQPGWVSGMAQGIALSAFARAYQVTCDEKYLAAGRRALKNLLLPYDRGGSGADLRGIDPSLAGYVWYEEYPNAKGPAYTLNGFMYTLIGLHDFSLVDPASGAGHAFSQGVRSLTKVLPYYDFDGFSAYDLGPLVHGSRPNISARYHGVHLTLLSALYAITGESVLDVWSERWFATVGGTPSTCSDASSLAR